MNEISLNSAFSEESVREAFIKRLGEERAEVFIMSALSVIKDNAKLERAERGTIINAVAKAASVNLPIDPNLGFAYIIPYEDRKTGKVEAQFQLGYKGLIQLAHRSGRYININADRVVEGELGEVDRLTGRMTFDWIQDQDERNEKPTIGYFAYFKMGNGFEKYLFMTNKEMQAHGIKYSQSFRADKKYNSKKSLWNTDLDAMAKKTVLKLLLSKYGQLSVQMQDAILADQAVVREGKLEYVDNGIGKPSLEENNKEKELQRLKDWINRAESPEKLSEANEAVYNLGDDELIDLYEDKAQELEVDISV